MLSCANSFSGETPVWTAQGARPIATIAVGDQVLAFDETTQTTGLFTVTAIISHTDPAILALLISGERLETTKEHPFFTLERGWVAAGDLWLGAHVRRADGSPGVVQAIVVVRQPQVMYNLTVAGAHTFFVGWGTWLVHNAGPCRIDPGGKSLWPNRFPRTAKAEISIARSLGAKVFTEFDAEFS